MDKEVFLGKLAEKESWCKSGFEGLCLDVIDKYWWGVVVELLLFVLCFYMLGIICDEYLIPSLEIMCVKLNLKEDVAGASFMAFGSSAPEIVISIITNIKGGDNIDLGVGSIIGAGMLGIMLVPGICGISAKRPLELKRRPLTRDVLFYVLSLAGLVYFLEDGVVYGIEGVYLILIYVAYLLLLIFAPMVRRSYRIRKHLVDPNSVTTSFIKQESIDSDDEKTYEPINERKDIDGELAVEETFNPVDASIKANQTLDISTAASKVVSRLTNGFNLVVARPIKWFFGHVVPRCTHGTRFEYLYPVTFLVSIFWLGLCTFVMSAVCQRWVELVIAQGFYSPSVGALMGMIVVALGSSVADIMQCIAVSKKGYGSMAISNSVGSQILNICMGLGLPWLIKALVTEGGIAIPGSSVVATAGILLAIGSLFFIGITLVPALIYRENKCKLGKMKGYIMAGSYIVCIIVYSISSLRK